MLKASSYLLRVALVAVVVAGVTRAQAPMKTDRDAVARKRVVDQLKKAHGAFADAEFGAAITHAEAAAADAEKSLRDGAVERRVAATYIKLAKGHIAALESDLKTAKAEVQAAVTLSRNMSPNSSLRRETMVEAADIHLFILNDPLGALALYEEAAPNLAQLKPGDWRRVRCAILTSFVRSDRGDSETQAIRGLAEAIGPTTPGAQNAGIPIAARDVWRFAVHRRLEESAAGGVAVKDAEVRLRSDLDRAGAILRKAGAGDGLIGWGDLYMLRFQFERGRFGAAEVTLRRLAARTTGAPGQAVPSDFLAEYRSYEGALATRRGDYVAAREAHTAERLIREKADQQAQRFGMHLALSSLGQLYLRVGDYRNAENVLNEAAAHCAKTPALKSDPIHAQVLTQLARAVEGTGELGQAETLHRNALAVAEKSPRREPILIAMCRNNLGVNRYAAGDLTTAGRELSVARALAASAGGESSLNVAEIDVNLGWVARTEGKSDEAERRFRAALKAIAADSTDSRRYPEVLGYLASALNQSGHSDEAKSKIEEAVRIREVFLMRALRSAFSERERLAIAHELRFHPESRAWPGVLDTFLELAPALKIGPEDQYARVLVWKGAVGRSVIAGDPASESDPEISAALGAREALLNDLRAETAEVPSVAERAAHEKRLAALELAIGEQEQKIYRKDRRLAASAEATPAAVIAALPKDWALVDVIEVRRPSVMIQEQQPLQEDRHYVAFVARAGRPVARIDLGNAVPIDAAIGSFLSAMKPKDMPTDDYVGPANKLATLIRDPIRGELDGAVGLILAGDGLLHRLPLAALPGSKPGSFWIEDIAFATVPSAQSLIVRRNSRTKRSGALIVGGVEYDNFLALPPLKETKREAEAVAAAFRRTHPDELVSLVTDRDASKPKVREPLVSRGVIHLATHGLFADLASTQSSSEALGPIAALDSALVLARDGAEARGKSADPYDQKLTADELARMDLRGVELIVLSACSSGLAHISTGQGVVGLVGALDRAGARAVACSLWKVDDMATSALMASFYEHLWDRDKATGPALALRSAQIALLRGTPPSDSNTSKTAESRRFEHPRFWAAFFISGDPVGAP